MLQFNLLQLRHQNICGHQGDIGILAGIRHGFLQEHLIKRQSIFAFAGNFLIGDCFMAQKIQCDLIQIVGSFRGIQQVGGHHGIKYDAVQLNAMTVQDDPVIFYVLADLFNCRILQYRFELV